MKSHPVSDRFYLFRIKSGKNPSLKKKNALAKTQIAISRLLLAIRH